MSMPQIQNVNIEPQAQPAAAETAPKGAVDLTAATGTTVEPAQETNTPKTGFDSDTKHISPAYIKTYMSGINKSTNYTENQNGDGYNLTSSLNDTEGLRNSFKLDFLTQANNRKSYEEANNLFATLDNNGYKYGRLFFQGSWVNTRTPIDAEGNATGLPEMLPA